MEDEEPLEISSRPSNFNHALPFGLLGAVFSHISGDPLDLRYAILVCRSWHNAIVYHANLWTNITLGYTFLTRFRGARLPRGDAFVRSCLSRSSPLPLHITIHDPSCAYLYARVESTLSCECFSLLTHILVSKSGEPGNLFQRCKSLTWFSCNGLKEVNFVARAFTSSSPPSLEYLTICMKFSQDERPLVRFPRLPLLKEVTLISCSDIYATPLFHEDDVTKAERLTVITAAGGWVDNDVNCIHRFRGIRTLMLEGLSLIFDCYYQRDPLQPAELPLLETLALSGTVPQQVLNLIIAPGLRKTEIEAYTHTGRHSLATYPVHLVRSLEYLYLSLRKGRDTTCWFEHLERLVDEAPSLVNVRVSPWMALYLKQKEWRPWLHITESIAAPPLAHWTA
jgi:hypothetical protein